MIQLDNSFEFICHKNVTKKTTEKAAYRLNLERYFRPQSFHVISSRIPPMVW